MAEQRVSSGSAAQPLAIVGCSLVDGTGKQHTSNDRRGVLIQDGRIARVAAEREILATARATSAAVLDATDCTVIPGLIDGHVHLAWNSERRFDWRAEPGDGRELVAFALMSAQSILTSGVTTVRDCGAPGGASIAARDSAIARHLPVPRMVVCGPAVTTPGGHGEYLGQAVPDTPRDLRRVAGQLAAQGADFVKVMATGGSTDPHTDRRGAQYSVDSLRALVATAHARRLRVVAHANATEGIRRAVEAGVDTIAHCNWLGREEGTLDYDFQVARSMAVAGTSVDLNLEGGMASLVGRDVSARSPSVPQDRWALFAEMRELGVEIFLTSDRPGPSAADFPQLLVAAARQWQLGADELIWRVTGLAAKSIGIGGVVGTIEQGKIADLVLLEGDLRDDLTALERVASVYRHGRPIGNHLPAESMAMGQA